MDVITYLADSQVTVVNENTVQNDFSSVDPGVPQVL